MALLLSEQPEAAQPHLLLWLPSLDLRKLYELASSTPEDFTVSSSDLLEQDYRTAMDKAHRD